MIKGSKHHVLLQRLEVNDDDDNDDDVIMSSKNICILEILN